MLDHNKDINEELSELNIIFEKISNKYKNQSDEYLFSTTLEKYLLNPKTTNNIDIIQNDVFFNIRYPFCFLKRKNKKDIEVQFLVKAKFIDENNENFSFWVCSFQFFKEALQSLGYKDIREFATVVLASDKGIFDSIQGKDFEKLCQIGIICKAIYRENGFANAIVSKEDVEQAYSSIYQESDFGENSGGDERM